MSNRILIVEDEFIIAKDLERMLMLQNWRVSGICSRAEDALEHINADPPDLVLIDIILKGKKGGIELGSLLAQRTNIPFVYITSLTDKATIEAVANTSPAGYIVKPFRLADVLATVGVALASRRNSMLPIKSDEASELSNIPIRLRKVAQYIQENLSEKLRVDLLAKMTPWNMHHFIRNFKKYMGCTPYQYVLKCRIRKAKERLINENTPISVIAKQLGFSSHSGFSTAFLKAEKCTAESFRRRLQ